MPVLKEWLLPLSIRMTKNVWGLTGGIGSGKTTLASFLTKIDKNIVMFNCDQVAKEIMADEAKKNEMIFDKKKIAEIIFNNPEEKEKLEKLIHPKVWQILDELIDKSKEKTIILVESAILFNLEKKFSKTIATICDLEERKKRIRVRNNWSETEIDERIRNQLEDDILVKKSLVVVKTDGSLADLKIKAEKLYQYLKENKDEKIIL